MVRSHIYRRLLLACCLTFAMGLGAQSITVILLRHAERQSLFDGDSPLNEAGQDRAQKLVPLLSAFNPTVLYSTDLKRTQQTLAPLAGHLGMKVLARAKDGSEALAAEILRGQRGQTVLVCWHHDLMKKVVRGLGVKGPVPYWPLDTYDWLWIVHIPAQGEATLETRIQALAPTPTALAERR